MAVFTVFVGPFGIEFFICTYPDENDYIPMQQVKNASKRAIILPLYLGSGKPAV